MVNLQSTTLDPRILIESIEVKEILKSNSDHKLRKKGKIGLNTQDMLSKTIDITAKCKILKTNHLKDLNLSAKALRLAQSPS